jgi:hypothetical protein
MLTKCSLSLKDPFLTEKNVLSGSFSKTAIASHKKRRFLDKNQTGVFEGVETLFLKSIREKVIIKE